MCGSYWPIQIKSTWKKNPVELWACTMIDPATGWFEIKEIKTKRADVIANIVETTWLTRYPWPTQIILDRGKEFMAEITAMVLNDYGIKKGLYQLETNRQMPLWKESTKPLVISYVRLRSKRNNSTKMIHGMEF